jgi:hypothetical protein
MVAPKQAGMSPRTDISEMLGRFDPAASAATLPALVGIGLACGLLLWLFGSKVLRPAAAVLGGAIGSAVGVIAPTSLGIMEIAGVPASLFGLGAGAVLGMLIALALYRAVLTFSTGLVFGAAGLMAGLAFYAPWVGPTAAPDAGEPVAAVVDSSYAEAAQIVAQAAGDGAAGESADGRDATMEEMAIERAAVFVRATGDALAGQWSALEENARLIVLGTTLGALMFGLILGLAAPERASAVVTAALGSGLWLYCFAWLSVEEGAPWAGSLDLGARGWAIAWAVAAAVGVGAQVLLWPRRKAAKSGGEAGS